MVASAQRHPLDKIPEDVLIDIFQRLSYGDLASFAATASTSRRTVRLKLLLLILGRLLLREAGGS